MQKAIGNMAILREANVPLRDCVVLVNERDEVTGHCEKMYAHTQGLLHRALSVVIFNARGEVLLQRRASHKYHSAGLWTNTCCSHPFPDEPALEAAHRRLKEEMGMQALLHPAFSFVYRAELQNGLTEYEFDHVYFGWSDDLPQINREEADDFRYLHPEILAGEMARHPEQFTAWLPYIFPRIMSHLKTEPVYGV